MSHPFSQFFDPTGQYFDVDQSGPVWFLQGAIDTPERSCTMPSDTYLVCPIILYLNDYPCPDPTWQPPAGQSMEDWLTAGAKDIIDAIIPTSPFPLSLEVDGVAVNNFVSFRTTSTLFTFTGDLSMQAFDGCVTGSPQVGVSDGYMVILKPLPPGEHTLHFSGFGDVLVHLTVVEDGDTNSALPLDASNGTTAQAHAYSRGTITAASQVKTWSLIKTLYR